MMASDQDLIRNLIARYCFIADREDADAMTDLFWENAELDFGGQYRGRTKIREAFEGWIRNMRDPVEGLRHLSFLPAIRFTGTDAATAETYFNADGRLRESGEAIHVRGLYRDRFERRRGAWRFAYRQIVVMEDRS